MFNMPHKDLSRNLIKFMKPAKVGLLSVHNRETKEGFWEE